MCGCSNVSAWLTQLIQYLESAAYTTFDRFARRSSSRGSLREPVSIEPARFHAAQTLLRAAFVSRRPNGPQLTDRVVVDVIPKPGFIQNDLLNPG